jgi:hypothetical protein
MTNLQKQVLMHMPTDGKGVTAAQLHHKIYGRKPTSGSTRTMMALAHAGYLKRPSNLKGVLAGGYGYTMTTQGAEWAKAERERIASADENEGSDVVFGIQKYDEAIA